MIATKVNGKVYDGVFTSKGDEWKKRRSVLTPAFSANKMKMVSLVVVLIYTYNWGSSQVWNILVFIWLEESVYLKLSLSVHVHACVCTYVCAHAHVCMRSWLCVCVSAWVQKCTYIADGASMVLL